MSGKETEIATGKGTESGTEIEMKGGTETEESKGEMTSRHTARVKEVKASSASSEVNHFQMNDTFHGCHSFIFLSGRKDDEMDPMDPSAYSDAPR